MLHVWLIPILLLFGLALVAFYLVICRRGGDGVRKDGRCLTHGDEADPDQIPENKRVYQYITPNH